MAGSVTIGHFTQGAVRRIQVDWVADAAAATVPATALPKFEGRLLALTTNPGAVAPTDNYDITLVDDEGADRLQGLGVDRDTVNTESRPLLYSGTAIAPVVDGDETLTFTLAGNAVNSATGRAIFYYSPLP
ncbi:MAG TPA: hypothetical protein VN773_07285 [Verrucomicrobiae bacterium]|nr:hypothetical protein [Verrucomicrobiae bacterium]